MDSLVAFAIIFAVYAIGDAIATKTKAIVSMLFFASVAYLIGFWTILPTSLFADSQLLAVGGVLIAILLVHMGTIIKLRDFALQWKTVVVAFAACASICVGAYFLGSIVMDRGYALVGAPVLSGAVVASLIMSEAATNAGLPDLAVFATLVLVVQGFVGYPLASLCLKSEAKRIRKLAAEGKIQLEDESATKAKKSKLRIIPPIPEKYRSANVIIAKLAIIALFATFISNLTDGNVNKLVICLIFGVLFKEIGFLEEGALTEANAFSLVMAATTLAVFANLTKATPAMVGSMLVPLLLLVGIGVASFVIVSILLGKVFKYSWQMSVAIGSSALFGFPGTFIVSSEVANAVAENEEEKKLILQQIMPKMLIAGMVTVSIASVIFAGIMANWL